MPPPAPNTASVSSSSREDQLNSLTKEKPTESNAIQIPEISLPKGGGALKGIDEKFEVNAANGTAGFNIPLPASPGRNGFSPALSLSYNSGGGNSPFGLGWSVDLPAIQRRTDKRLPRYREGKQEDIFLFSGAEDLVPFMEENSPGEWKVVEFQEGDYLIRRYRPRIEGGFSRIEKIAHPLKGVYWKVTSGSNVATIFGGGPQARIADPEDATRIFQWLPEFSYDDKGNWITYEYKSENLDNVPAEQYEKNRIKDIAPFTNKYLKQVRYGNRKPYYADPSSPYNPQAPEDQEHFFELVFDFGEHDSAVPAPDEMPGQLWNYRTDAFSNYRPGFEVRTNRLCRRILMFHHFEELGTEPYLVRSLDLEYQPSSINESGQAEVTYLKSITQTGYIRKEDGTYACKSLPPLEFDYQPLQWNTEKKTVSKEYIANAPAGLTNNYQWVDLYAEGISGILSEQGEGWFYKSNLGDVEEDGTPAFTVAHNVIPRPSFSGISTGVLTLRDLEANGERQVVSHAPAVQGYFGLTIDNKWKQFTPFQQIANVDLSDPHTRFIDLDGDGQPELVVSEEHAFVWYAANGKKGYHLAEWAAKTFDEDRGPAIVFAERDQSIFLADVNGDGLTDIIRIRNGEICYWANKGYGRFGAKVEMGNAPWFDQPDLFHAQYLHLADVSGTGATDILYLGKNQFKAFLNLSGNAWSDPHEIAPFFPIDRNTRLSVVDLLGTGTSCIVWSSDLPAFQENPMRFIDLMNSKKPHVLTHYRNNLGKETAIEYKSSTWYYLKDKREGRPWITKLPFPVQVVSRLTVEEKSTEVRFSTEYRYHHGYYDHPEREFRGFGMVEQVDTEHYESWMKANAGNKLEKSEELFQKLVLTKTWFHTGAFRGRERILNQFEQEYWYEEFNRQFPESPLSVSEPCLKDAEVVAVERIQDQSIVDQWSGDEWREALRACKGMMLRQEVFALDAPLEAAAKTDLMQQAKPYSVTTHNCTIQLLQPRGDYPYGVFLVTESEALSIAYERDETDPRIAHTLSTRIDELGNILEAASVVYPRQKIREDLPTAVQEEQQKTWITYTRSAFTNDVIRPEAYRLRAPAETETFEITGLPKASRLFQLEDFRDVLSKSQPIAYQDTPTSGILQRRPIEHIRTLYYKDDLSRPLPLYELEARGFNYESYQLAYTPSLLNMLFGERVKDSEQVMTEGRFVPSEGDENWWIRSGITQFYDEEKGETLQDIQNRFYAPLSYTDPFGSKTTVSYYQDYFLFLEATEDALHNRIQVEKFDFRTLAPTKMRDINDNLSEALTDELGLVKATALLGKDLDGNGLAELELADNLNGLNDISEAEQDDIQAFFETEDSVELEAIGRRLLQQAGSRIVYDFDAYRETGKPNVAATIVRETHHAHLKEGEQSKIQFSFAYSDGLGNIAMAKTQAEPGLAQKVNFATAGSYQIEEVDTSKMEPKRLRWVGNGRTILNNKGNPVKQYEPYFSTTPHYEEEKELVETGVTPILYYDALGRLIKTELPDQTFTKVEFDAWQQASYDQNDTVKDSPWYTDRINRRIDAELIAAGKDPAKEQEAARKAAQHNNTPARLHLDTLGRPILSIAHNRSLDGEDEFYHTRVVLDIEGNTKKVIDARGNTVMAYAYDLLGHRVYQNSMDAGERWLLNNVMGYPVLRWDSRNHIFSFAYDALQRPVESRVKGGDGEAPLDNVYEMIVYGEGQAEDKHRNLRGKVYVQYDTAGKLQFPSYDLKGNLLKQIRQLAKDYKSVPHWPDSELETETFTTEIQYDALNRPTATTTPDGSITQLAYNEANLLETVIVTQNGKPQVFVKNIDYDAKGQRQSITYGNGLKTKYQYDKKTFRLLHLVTSPPSGGD